MLDLFIKVRARLFFATLSLALIAFALSACNSTPPTPTRTPTSAIAAAPPTNVAPPAPPAVSPSLAPVPVASPTLTSTGAISPTRTVTRTVATRTPTAKPAPLAGRVVYSVALAPAPETHLIRSSNVDGSNPANLLSAAMWGALSPDGKQLAFFQMAIGVRNPGLYVADGFGAGAKAAILSAGVCCVSWSADGIWIVFTDSPRQNQAGPLRMVKADGSYRTILALSGEGNGAAFSPNGRQVAFGGCLTGTSTCGVLVIPADGSGTPRALTTDQGGNPRWSPKGDKIVYTADAGGRLQVFSINADGTGKKQLTTGKGNDGQPVWSRDGSSILWRSDQDGTHWAISVMNADGTNPRKIIADAPPDQILWGWESLSVGP